MSAGSRTSAVYSTREKVLLAELVKENPILENKKTDGATVAEKNRAWEIVTTTYNSQPEVTTSRTSQQLRKLWNNLKQRKRKETTTLRHDMLATGGGPAKVIKYDLVLKFVSEAAASLDVTVNCPWDSTHLFERAGARGTLALGNTADIDEVTDEPYFSGNSSAEPMASTSKASAHFSSSDTPGEPVPSTSTGTDELLFSGNSSTKEPATPVVAKEFTNSCSTTTSKGVVAKKRKVLPEEKLRRSRLVEAAHQQQELHNLKKLIAEEELLRVKEERKLLAQRGEVIALDLRRAALEHQRAADEAELASLKLKQFKKVMLSEDP